MSTNDKFRDWNRVLQPFVDEGYVSKTPHPTLPLSIYNYTPQCLFEKKWNTVTLMARGLVVDEHGQRVNAPMQKFFNFEETEGRAIAQRNVGNDYTIHEKVDGSAVFVTKWTPRRTLWDRLRRRHTESHVLIHTRGSFESPQACEARNWLREHHGTEWIEAGYTYIFEWIAPDNRIVVNYDNRRELVLLWKQQIANPRNAVAAAPEWGGTVAWNYGRFSDAEWSYVGNLKSTIASGLEGFVIRWSSGDRIKIKSEEYLSLHRALTGLSTYTVWEQAQKSDEEWNTFLSTLDEEGRLWAESHRKSFEADVGMMHSIVDNWVEHFTLEGASMKEVALQLEEWLIPKYEQHAVFAALRGQSDKVTDIAWKRFKPQTKREKFSSGLSH